MSFFKDVVGIIVVFFLWVVMWGKKICDDVGVTSSLKMAMEIK
jgi:hypothetical protein